MIFDEINFLIPRKFITYLFETRGVFSVVLNLVTARLMIIYELDVLLWVEIGDLFHVNEKFVPSKEEK